MVKHGPEGHTRASQFVSIHLVRPDAIPTDIVTNIQNSVYPSIREEHGYTNESQSSHLTRVTSSEEIVLVTGNRLALLESKKPTSIATSSLLRFAIKHAGVSAEYVDQKLIEQEEFEGKWPGTEGLRVVRQRYFVPELSDDRYPKLLLDVYEGLESDTRPILAVVASGNMRQALRSQALMNSERIPSWLGRNITRDFSLIQLAEKGQLTAKGRGKNLLQQTARIAA